ncbi:MAG TPA: DUF4230 domain-containing protein, partial [Candidatus Mediterraneibacter merdavium]|nr:DUF4230 domain-containing protein [Candidatus Mediterraneibacter merdavium]
MEQQNKEPKKKGSIFGRILGNYIARRVFGIILIIAVVCAIGFGVKNYIVSDSKTTKIGFEDIGELATQTAYCTEVNVTDASRELFGMKIPFTQSKYIYSYDIEIKAGFDFTEIEWDVNGSTIEVRLPEAKILSSEVDQDSLEVYHEDESIFRQISLEENNEAVAKLRETAVNDAIENGLLENARENAESILTSFFAEVYD